MQQVIINKISPNPSLPKRGNGDVLPTRLREDPKKLIACFPNPALSDSISEVRACDILNNKAYFIYKLSKLPVS
jgi:hypothetical protein